MKRMLLTGMSGVGKSTLARALRSERCLSVDLDEGWMLLRSPDGERIIDVPRVERLFDTCRNRHIVLAGTAVNQGELYGQLDEIIVLTAPLPVMRARIMRRTDNPFGKTQEEWAKIVRDKAEVEPLLLRGCTRVLQTDRPPAEVLRALNAMLYGAAGPQ